MNIILITAFLGLLCRQWYVVDRAVRPKPGVQFDVLYYLRDNWFALVGNALGATLLYFAAPAVMIALRWCIGKWTDNADFIEMLTDTVMAPVTGALIGLMGGLIVDKIQDKAKDFFSMKGPDKPDFHPQA